MVRTKPSAGVEAGHPLDPLSESEVALASEILKKEKRLGPHARFTHVQLEEPAKSDVLGWKPAAGLPRRAAVTLFDSQTGATHVAMVDLASRRVTAWREYSTKAHPYGQPPITIEEVFKVGDIVKADADWRRAMQRRGLDDKDIELVQVDPFSAGYFDREVEKGRRLVSAVSYWRKDLKDNGYAHPIEGVVALVDLIENRIVHLVDEPDIIPIPKKSRNYDRASIPQTRKDVKPLDVVQKDGPSFTVEGWQVHWQNWSFRVGWTAREGLVLHQIAFRDHARERPIIYRASVTDMIVPYADPTANHFWKCAFDAGEYGLGKLANALELGCDCLGHIHYFDVPVADDYGKPAIMKNAICLHEEDHGILWKHYEFRNETFEVRRSRRLVISFFTTVGNYDYGFFWYFYQDGTIQLEVKLTGIIQTAAIAPGKSYPWGGMVDENLGGPTHQHFFNARLHMMLDGEGNTVTEHEFRPRPWGTDNPYGNVFDTTSRILSRERDAVREADGRTGRYWKITNPNQKNSVGGPTAYKLLAHSAPVMLAQEGCYMTSRGGFATKHIWVTRYAPDERYASGEFPNQHAGGDGLPKYVAKNRSIENQDIVVWHSFGATHVCRPEDFPVMPVEYVGFTLKPNGFFAENPAMDLPPDRNSASRDNRDKDSCCG
ncbi:primary-amine oxidase [Bradyrhizobium sp. 200]|uniref:primary-amine oxidase n=1 Tax=Bradyrhizobium sp. 200 TaxID=2782665 RepID=UPI001FFF10A3|nr:primary-amine oxidase [Bradyrhizobium sp. 200]UPJ50988.1 primary-amine oxidase [Bradyrhizobium sp. 200]